MAYSGGKEKRVNATSAGSQTSPEITALHGGGWVVTWSSYGQDGSGNGVYQQRYNADGTKSVGESLVPTTTTGSQFQTHAASLTDGGWVVAWTTMDAVNGAQIRLQAYNENGTKQGVEMQANTTSAGEQSTAEVTGLTTGGWVVTWQGEDPDTSNGDSKFDIYQQAYDQNGNKVGGETMVNTGFTTSDQFDSSVTALANGRWAVTWCSYAHASDTSGIYTQIYQANGTKLGGEIHVNTYTPGNQYNPETTTLENGDFLVTWESQGEDGSGYGIYQQRFNADGSVDGGEKRVNKTVTGDQDTVDVTALSTGGYVVTWQSEKGADKSGYGIYGQVYNANGGKVGTEFLVNKHTNSEQTECSVAGIDKGRFVVTWQSYDVDGDGSAIMQRVFSDAGKKLSMDKLTLDFRPSIEGTGKDDTLTGKDIGEKFYGKGGDDTISGKGGADLLDGGKGDDLLIGGDGKDVFVFKTGYGADTIRGFFEGDRIDVRGLDGIADFGGVTDHATQVGADVRIMGPDGDVLWIRHGLLGQLDETDFIFAV